MKICKAIEFAKGQLVFLNRWINSGERAKKYEGRWVPFVILGWCCLRVQKGVPYDSKYFLVGFPEVGFPAGERSDKQL